MVEEQVTVGYISPWTHQEYTFRHRSAYGTPAESLQEDLTSGKAYIEPRKTQQDEGTRGGNRSISRRGHGLGRWRNRSRGPTPSVGQLSESEEKHLSETAGLWQPRRNENQTVLAAAYIYRAGTRSPGRGSGWDLEFKDYGANPGRGLRLTVDRWIEGM